MPSKYHGEMSKDVWGYCLALNRHCSYKVELMLKDTSMLLQQFAKEYKELNTSHCREGERRGTVQELAPEVCRRDTASNCQLRGPLTSAGNLCANEDGKWIPTYLLGTHTQTEAHLLARYLCLSVCEVLIILRSPWIATSALTATPCQHSPPRC